MRHRSLLAVIFSLELALPAWVQNVGFIAAPTYRGNAITATGYPTAPNVSVTAPSTGIVSGNVTMMATCSDNVACAYVQFQVDGAPVGAQVKTSPYTAVWHSATWIDGSHTITAVATNIGGISTTSSGVAVTPSNGVTAKTVYLDPVAGLDTNNCLAPTQGAGNSGPCQTVPHITGNFVYHGGDTIALKQSTTTTLAGASMTQALSLLGGSRAQGGLAVNAYSAGASAPITITSYGGGTCAVIAGITTGCATLAISGTHTSFFGLVNIINLSNVIVENLRIVCTGNSSSQNQHAQAVHGGGTGTIFTGVTFTNLEVVDCASGIQGSNNYNNFAASSPLVSSYTITDNYVHGSSYSVTLDDGIDLQNVGSDRTPQSVIQGNYVTNINGGRGPNGTTMNGNGITIRTSDNVLDQFNVVSNGGSLNTSCGGPAANWTHEGSSIIFQFNESYGMGYTSGGAAGPAGGCDNGAYDFDGGTQHSIYQYNYSHGNWGAAFLNYNATAGGHSWGYNIWRYNISENDQAESTDNTMGVLYTGFGGSNGWVAYNNTIYNSLYGATIGGHTVRNTLVVGGNCGQYIANNIFISTGAAFAFLHGGNCAGATLKTNDWYGSATWMRVGCNSPSCDKATLAAWQAAVNSGDVGSITSNPSVTNSGNGGTCYSSGIPAGPQPCPSAYVLSSTSSPVIGVGSNTNTDLSSFNTAFASGASATRDYYGNAVPHAHGSGFNIGADGGYP